MKKITQTQANLLEFGFTLLQTETEEEGQILKKQGFSFDNHQVAYCDEGFLWYKQGDGKFPESIKNP